MSPETSFGLTGRPAGGAAYGAATGAASAAMTRAVSGNSVSPAEAKAWASFFSLAASSPAFADEITRLFDADPCSGATTWRFTCAAARVCAGTMPGRLAGSAAPNG